MKSTRQAREKLSKSLKGSSTVELTEGQEVEIVLSVDEVLKAKQTMVDAGKIRYYNNTQQQFRIHQNNQRTKVYVLRSTLTTQIQTSSIHQAIESVIKTSGVTYGSVCIYSRLYGSVHQRKLLHRFLFFHFCIR